MKPMQFTCQNCDQQHEKIKHFKVHIRSHSHKKVVANLFHTAVHQGPVFFPICVVLDYLRNPEKRNPLIGLDMVTLFITPEKYGSFYLCHVCEQQLSTGDVVHHLCSEGHYFKYLAYSNPELLRFAWLEDSFSYLEFSAKKENSNNGSGNLRIFELSAVMLQRGKEGSFHQVMSMFSLTKHLVERVMAGRPQRKTLQAYMTDPIRKNPLLGLNFLLEYSCTESEQHCGYLCLLCKKKLQAIESISHCISFDHVYCYLKTFHPSMINCPKSSYSRYSYAFHKKIFSVATQAQNDSPHRELQNTHVNLSDFNDIDSCSYEAALGKLQLIRKETNQSELMVAVAPGAQISFEPETKKPSADLETTHSPAEQTAEKTHKESTGWKDDQTCRVLCVECNKTLSSTSDYKLHAEDKEHYLKLIELFGPGGYRGSLSVIKLYDHMWSNCGNTLSSPLIGLQLLTVFVDRQSQCYNPPIYLCHACELNIPVSSVCSHLSSPHHYFNVFKFTNPDLVYLVSQNLDPILELAQEAAMRQGKDELVLRVCEIPTQLCRELRNMAYNKIFTVIWKNYNLRQCVEVQRRVTLQSYNKSSDRKSPLLGLRFMVKYSTTRSHLRCGYFCLLCESKLSERDAIAHVLSLTHVCAYLNVAHPGSLTKEDKENKSLVADLAEQAERVSSGALQEVALDDGKFFEVEKSTFKTAMDTLQLIFKAEGLGELKFSVAPGDKLVPSNEKNSQNLSSQCVEESSPTSHEDQINLHAECTETTKMDSHSPHLTPKYAEPQNDTSANSDSTAHPVESSVQVEVQLGLSPALSLLPASTHTEQFRSQQNETQSLKQAVCPCPNPAKAKDSYPVVKHPQPRDTSQKQTKKLNQKTGKSSKSPAHVKNKRQPVSQASPTSTELWDYLRMTKREPVIGVMMKDYQRHANQL